VSREKVVSFALSIAAVFIFSSFLDSRFASGVWFGIGLVCFVTSLIFHSIFLEKHLIEGSNSIYKEEVRSFNTIISYLGLIIIYLLFPIVVLCLIYLRSEDNETKVFFIKQLELLLPFFNFNHVYLYGITQSSDIQHNPVGILQPLITFLQLVLIEFGLLLSLNLFFKKSKKTKKFHLLTILVTNISLTIISLLTFLYFLKMKNSLSIFAPIGFLWFLTIGSVFAVFGLLTKHYRHNFKFFKYTLLISILPMLVYAAISTQILNLMFFLFFTCAFFILVTLLLTAHESMVLTDSNVLPSIIRSFRIVEFSILSLLVALPIAVILAKSRADASLASVIYFAIILSLPVNVLILKFKQRISRFMNISNWLFAYFWAVNTRARSTYKLKMSRRFFLIITALMLTYSSALLSLQLYSQNLNRVIVKSSQIDDFAATRNEDQFANLGIDGKTLDTLPETTSAGENEGDSNALVDQAWMKKIVAGIHLDAAPSQIVTEIKSLTQDQSFASSSCKNLISSEFRKGSEISVCTSEILGAPLALFVGNSHGSMLQDSVAQSLNELGYSEIGIFTSSCTVSANVIPLLNSKRINKCKSYGEDLLRFIASQKPEIIVVSQNLNVSVLNAAGDLVMGAQAQGFLRSNIESTLKTYQSMTSKVIVIDAFPEFPRISTCMNSSGQLNSCVSSTSKSNVFSQMNRSMAQNLGIDLIQTLPWICYQGQCPAIIDETLVSPDGSHLTPQFARVLKPKIKAAFSNIILGVK